MTKISKAQEQYLKKASRRTFIIHAVRILLLILFVFVWEYAAKFDFIDDFIFCSPSIIINCASDMVSQGILQTHLFSTIKVTFISFFLVTLLSNIIALLLWMSKGVTSVLEPYLVILNSLPKSALAPLFIVWFGNNSTTIVVAGVSVAIFGAILTLYTSFCEIDPEKIKLIYTLGGNRMSVLTKLLLPGSIPAIISNMKVNIGLCLIGIVIGEMISSKSGLGYLIIYGTQVFKLDYVILSIIILCIIAIIFYIAMNLTEKAIHKHFQ